MGDFVQDSLTGNGAFYWTNGQRYQGKFLDGKPHGTVEVVYADGARYVGDFVQGKMTGWGADTMPEGSDTIAYIAIFVVAPAALLGTFYAFMGMLREMQAVPIQQGFRRRQPLPNLVTTDYRIQRILQTVNENERILLPTGIWVDKIGRLYDTDDRGKIAKTRDRVKWRRMHFKDAIVYHRPNPHLSQPHLGHRESLPNLTVCPYDNRHLTPMNFIDLIAESATDGRLTLQVRSENGSLTLREFVL